MIKFKLNSKGMKDEGKKLKVSQRVFLTKVLEGSWLYEMGWGDSEYIRLHHILTNGTYFDFDKGMLNTIRSTWLESGY